MARASSQALRPDRGEELRAGTVKEERRRRHDLQLERHGDRVALCGADVIALDHEAALVVRLHQRLELFATRRLVRVLEETK